MSVPGAEEWEDDDRAAAMLDEEQDEPPIRCSCSSCSCGQIVDFPGRCPMCAEACPPAAWWKEGD